MNNREIYSWQRWIMRVVRLKAVKSCLKTTVQHLYPLQLQRERKDNHALVEE